MRHPSCKLVVLLLSTLAAGVACGPPPRAALAPAPSRPPASTEPAAASPELVIESPHEARCGIDDGPVPLGRRPHEDDLRGPRLVEGRGDDVQSEDGPLLGIRLLPDRRPPPPVGPAPPWPQAEWTLGAGIAATPAFQRRAEACATAALATDAGEHRFAVRLPGRGGVPFSVRSQNPQAAASTLRSCFQAALCDVANTATSDQPGESSLVVSVKMMPAVFHGDVDFTTLEESAGLTTVTGAPTGRKVPRRGPWSEAEHAWFKRFPGTLTAGTLACARATPPAATVGLQVRFPFDKRTRRFTTALAGDGQSPFERTLSRCFAEAAVKTLETPPLTMIPNGALTIFVTFTVAEGPR